MIDDLDRLRDLEDQRVGLQFKVTQLMELVDGFRDEIKTIIAEESQIYRTMGRPCAKDFRNDLSGQGFTRSEEAVAFYLKQQPPLSNKEIGGKLNISERTVKFHVCNIYRKLGIEPKEDNKYSFGGNQFTPRVIAMQKLSGM